MLHLGDITKIDGAKVPTVEVVIGGSPCQDLSVAGKRAGLAGERSGLFMEQIRIIKEMRVEDERNGAINPRPRYMVWENVPGAFSSNGGEDFRAVLEETARVADSSATIPRPTESWTNAGAIMGNGWSLAWRVLDAQFWGVPQRRRRIALVADFGGLTAPEILFERNGMSRYSPPSRTSWEDFTAAVTTRFGSSNSTERTIGGPGPHQPTYCIQGNCVDRPDTAACNGKGWAEGVGYTLNTVDRHVVYDARGNGSGDTVPTLTGDHESRVTDYTALCVRARCGCEGGGGKGLLIQKEKNGTLTVNNDQFVVAIDRAAFNQGINARYDMEISEDGINSTLTARGPSAVCAGFKANVGAKAHGIGFEQETAPTLSTAQQDAAVVTAEDVRRLTPTECERLQGYPDGWTLLNPVGDMTSTEYEFWKNLLFEKAIREEKARKNELGEYEVWRKKKVEDENGEPVIIWENTRKLYKHKTKIQMIRWYNRVFANDADSARYKALGNSIALPPWVWLLERLNSYCVAHTMASLFDGIGGFPLIWEKLNGKGSCLWASEIEEFPIAVTRKRFNDVRSQQTV